MNRRSFLKGAAVFGGALAVAGIGARLYRNQVGRDYDPARTERLLNSLAPAPNPEELPNIVLIVADDLGYADLGAYGGQVIKTPRLDRMAAEGVLLTNFYACAPVCTPSRAGIMTGRYAKRSHMTLPLYPHNHPMEYFLKLVDRYQYDVTGIPADEALLSEILHRSGYRTGLVGKWHLGDQPGHLPNDNGFDDFYGALHSNDVSKFAVWRNDKIEIPAPVEQTNLTQYYTREALQFIQANQARPFFLNIAHTAVHEPLFASTEFQGSSQGGLYGDSVREVDWSVGQVLDKLTALGLDENTLVIFTSDNGPWWQGNPGGFRGRKNNITDGGLRVPFIARWPAQLPAGLTSHELSINFDIFPTCLSSAGLPIPADRVIDGEDMLPVLKGKAPGPHVRFFYYDGPILVAVRYQHWKYQRRHMSDNGGYPLFSQGPFLFDLEKDPNESYSLIETYPDIALRLSKMLNEWEAELESNLRGWI
ncbi:MAG TPA: sulfatase-like hydrolase/transferase [Anaerolineales bacterium]|nr:sulfatase-like hydrolase/transferase [Anaerolineales bacterium]